MVDCCCGRDEVEGEVACGGREVGEVAEREGREGGWKVAGRVSTLR